MTLTLSNSKIGLEHRPYIIAEMSGNHNQSLDKALRIVEAAGKAGAHALKIQTYTADTMTLPIREREFMISDKNSLWIGKSLYDLYEEAHTPWDWHYKIKQECENQGMDFFSTPFDKTAVDFLEELSVPFYKIASFENTDLNLIREVAGKGKPVIVSTGMATVAEIQDIVNVFRELQNSQLILLKCTSSYPASPLDSNIRTIPHLRELFNVEVGLSDHTLGVGVAVASVALGARVIEKHFTIDRSEGGVDSAFSLEPAEMRMLVEETNRAWQSLGEVKYQASQNEEGSKLFRRSIYISKDMKRGDLITEEHVRCIRPGYGLAPKYYSELLGRKVNQDLKVGDPMKFDYVLFNN